MRPGWRWASEGQPDKRVIKQCQQKQQMTAAGGGGSREAGTHGRVPARQARSAAPTRGANGAGAGTAVTDARGLRAVLLACRRGRAIVPSSFV